MRPLGTAVLVLHGCGFIVSLHCYFSLQSLFVCWGWLIIASTCCVYVCTVEIRLAERAAIGSRCSQEAERSLPLAYWSRGQVRLRRGSWSSDFPQLTAIQIWAFCHALLKAAPSSNPAWPFRSVEAEQPGNPRASSNFGAGCLEPLLGTRRWFSWLRGAEL